MCELLARPSEVPALAVHVDEVRQQAEDARVLATCALDLGQACERFVPAPEQDERAAEARQELCLPRAVTDLPGELQPAVAENDCLAVAVCRTRARHRGC